MFGHNHMSYDEFHGQFTLQDAQFLPPHLSIPEHDSVSAITSSAYGGAYMIPRSHSLHKNMQVMQYSSSPPAGSYFECESSSSTSVRKVLSTGDLQSQRSSSPLVNETSILESMNRANPYSPQEKKERIERYRSKRNLRNFNKKIKYECRKTLADSRPRIRGRFARNDELIEKAIVPQQGQCQWDNTSSNATLEELDEEYIYDHDDQDNWINFLDAFSANLLP